MPLPTLSAVINELDKEYAGSNTSSGVYTLTPFQTPLANVSETESRLGVSFPDEFVKLTTAYQFGELELGAIWFSDKFGVKRHYQDYVIAANQEPTEPVWPMSTWWDSKNGTRPRHLIEVAATDPHQVLLNVESGEVLAYDPAVESWEDSYKVANDFELFIRGAGYAELRRGNDDDVDEELAAEIEEAVGAEPGHYFWSNATI